MIDSHEEARAAFKRLQVLEGMIQHSNEFEDIECYHQIMSDTLEDLDMFADTTIPTLVIDNDTTTEK